MIKERFRNIRFSLLGIYNSVDSIVQIPKRGKISVTQLQHLARVVRAQVVVLTKQVELEQKRLEEWKYGKIIESESYTQSQGENEAPIDEDIKKNDV